ncbi:DUF3037 domain-containing protein [Cupriavidus gilardii]|uniref:DUF3037 domain-containing protein n=1 Tax=Cupriavidus gilardii TaxID=82541 RepID=A0ABY4VRG0_9BURK|nr:DUF3037 domain-containing protein [Cupriavidus gilardii]USE78867.1 DUF3037 domain-containing protein [Cupriavidus gilardii]
MTQTDFKFSVLRVIPNAVRGERVNVGLSTVDPSSTVRIHLHVNRDRLRALDPNLTAIDWENWAEQAETLLNSLPESARTQWLCTGLAPVIADKEFGWFKASQDGYDTMVDQLLERLVLKPRKVAERRKSGRQATHLQAQLRNWFKAEKIMGKSMDDLSRHRIVEEFPVSIETDSFADFAFKNGALHIMETLDLRHVDHLTARLRNQAAFKSVVLDQARDVVGDGKCIAIVAATDYQAVKPALRMIERNADEVLSIDSPQDVERLATRLSEALHLPNLLVPPALAS